MVDPSTQNSPALETNSVPAPIAAPEEVASASRSALGIVFLVVVIDLLGFGIVLPLLPRYAKDYVKPMLDAGEKDWRVGGALSGAVVNPPPPPFPFAPPRGR